MTEFFKISKKALLTIVIALSMTALASFSVLKQLSRPPTDEIRHILNISKDIEMSQLRAVKNSRLSAVRVLTISPDMMVFSSASGTYVTYDGKYYILTVNHGITGPCDTTTIVAGSKNVSCMRYVELNVPFDYAIIEVEKIDELKPIQIPNNLPKGDSWKNPLAVLSKIYYTGFPNMSEGPLTIKGYVMGFTDDDFILIHSYGWSGSSGSGVFSEKGELIGYVIAIDVGQTEYGVSVLEDVVYVVPTFKIDWSVLISSSN
tara:strand:- start:284 stop:1063 length:780 start_codon:yes stop_codon:yes gene_type:complete